MGNSVIYEEVNTLIYPSAQLKGLFELLVNEHYIFLDKDLKIINYSDNSVHFSKTILKQQLLAGLTFQELLANIDEDLSDLILKDFLRKNIREEIIDFKFKIGNEFLHLQLRKVTDEKHILGYCCLFHTQPLKEEITEIFDNMHLVANLAWFTSHKLRGPLSSIMSLIDQNSLPGVLNNAPLEELLLQMKNQAMNLDDALHTLNTLLSNKDKLTPVIPKLSDCEINNVIMLDDEIMTHMVTKRLVAEINSDISLFSFTDGFETLEYLQTFPTDLILLDLNMPKMNGWQFLDILTARNINTPTIIISSSIDINDVNRSFEYHQVKGFINKPVTKDDLKRILINHK